MSIKLEDIKKLREETGAGMMDCKTALNENNGDYDKSVEWLRKKGIAQAAKKTSRSAQEGVIGISVDNNVASIIEVNSETDFVAKNEQFLDLVAKILPISHQNGENIDQLNNAVLENGLTIKDYVTESIGKIGENIVLRRVKTLKSDQGFMSSYIHNSITKDLGKIGVLLAVKDSSPNDDSRLLAKQISMHIAASKPLALESKDVDSKLVEKEKEIFSEQAKASGKPDNIIEKMVEGRIRKFYEEVTLLNQNFVMDGKTKIDDLITEFNKKNNSDFQLLDFVRFELGEGLEKEENNFADEVKSIVAGS